MKQIGLRAIAVTSTFACATLLSIGWSEQGGVSLSVDSAQARVGRPATPVSAAGVARRQTRRGAYGAAAVGAGAVAAGTAAAVAATSPGWGWGGNPYYGGDQYGDQYAGGPYYGGGAYAPSAYGARAYYAPPSYAPPATENAPAWNLFTAYRQGGPWYGYSGWEDYKTRNGIGCDPGTVSNGVPCQ